MNLVDVLGRNYIEGVYESENSKEVEEDYRIIAAVNQELFNNIPFKVIFTEEDHYSSAKELREEVMKTGIMYVFTGGNEHEYFTPTENLIGRAVHDTYAHMVCGCPFTFIGELNAYFEQSTHYPKRVHQTLFAEIVSQAAAFHHRGDNFDFPQRAIRANKQDMELVSHLVKDYSENSVLSREQLVKGMKKIS